MDRKQKNWERTKPGSTWLAGWVGDGEAMGVKDDEMSGSWWNGKKTNTNFDKDAIEHFSLNISISMPESNGMEFKQANTALQAKK